MAIKQAIHPQRKGLRPGWVGVAVAAALVSMSFASPSHAQGEHTLRNNPSSSTTTRGNNQTDRDQTAEGEKDTRRGIPGRRVGGGSRGNDRTQNICPVGPQAMAMIAPEDNITLTSAAQPSLMFYINSAKQSRDVEFVLRDATTDTALYSKLLKLSPQGGLVTLDMSKLEDAPNLELEGDYYWYLSLICDSEDRAKDIVVEGHVRRIEGNPVASSALPTHSLQEGLQSSGNFSTTELWHDTMTQLNQLRQSATTPALRQAAQKQWQSVLEADRELSIIASETTDTLEPLAILDIQDPDLFE